jgi:hypothetical protein
LSGIGPFLWLAAAVTFAIFVCRLIAGDTSMDGDDSGGGD